MTHQCLLCSHLVSFFFSNVKIPAGKLLLTSGRPFISHRKIYLQPITALIKDLTLLLAQTMAKQLQRTGRGSECSPLEPGIKLLPLISQFPSITEHRAARDLKGLTDRSILPLTSRQTTPKTCLLLVQPVLTPHCSPRGSSISPGNLSPCLPTHSLTKFGFYFSLATVWPKSPLWCVLAQDLSLWSPCWYSDWQKEGGKVWHLSDVVAFQTHAGQTESVPE